MIKWWLLTLIFVLSGMSLVLIELMPEKYKKAARLALMPAAWIVSIVFGFMIGILGFILSALHFFNHCTQNGLHGILKDISKWMDD